MRKHWSDYFKGYPNFKPFRHKLMNVETQEEVIGILNEIKEYYY